MIFNHQGSGGGGSLEMVTLTDGNPNAPIFTWVCFDGNSYVEKTGTSVEVPKGYLVGCASVRDTGKIMLVSGSVSFFKAANTVYGYPRDNIAYFVPTTDCVLDLDD